MHHPAPVETTELYSWPQTDGKDGRAKGSGDDDDDAPLVVLSVVPLMRGAAVGSIEVVDRYWIDIGHTYASDTWRASTKKLLRWKRQGRLYKLLLKMPVDEAKDLVTKLQDHKGVHEVNINAYL
jgi:hypothetical protein